MAEGRDYTHEAYQAPFTERYAPQIGGTVILLLLVIGLAIWKPWIDKGRKPTNLHPEKPVRLSTAKNVRILQSRPTSRVAIHGAAIYVGWVDNRSTPPSVVMATSSDTGRTFSEQVLEQPPEGKTVSEPAVLCDSTGAIYLLYTFDEIAVHDKSHTSLTTHGENGQSKTTSNARNPLGSAASTNARLARSTDGGATWKQVVTVGSIYTHDLADPVMGIDVNDTIHVAAIGWVDGVQQVLVTRSVNHGESFEPDVEVSQADHGTRRDVGIAVTPTGRCAVVWSDLRNAPDLPENGIIFGALSNVGDKFSNEIALVRPALKPGRQRYPQVLLDDKGHLGIVFVEGVDKDHREKTVLRYAYSSAFGAKFNDSSTLFERQLQDPSSPQVVHGKGLYWYLVCLGTLTDYNQPTVAIAESRDGGRNFSALTPVADRFAPSMAFPSLAAQENTVVVSYFDHADPEGKPGTNEAYAVRIVDKAVAP